MKIGIDTLGGDYAPEPNLLGACMALDELSEDVRITLVGDEVGNKEILSSEGIDPDRFDFLHTTELIGMGEHPTKALARKKNSSIALGYQALKSNKIQAFCSTGNTGAMLVGAMLSVRAISGVIRPCITSILPQENGDVSVLLDVGSNADCKPDVLYQFGILGSEYMKHVFKVDQPRVALLNIGEEQEKGNLLAQAAHENMLDTEHFNFIGNVEGRDLFNNKADVIVCDGFTGNVVLKEAEAFYTMIKKRKLSDGFFDRFNYELYGGTPILGINSCAIIGHGISSPLAVKNMLILGFEVAEAQLSENIKKAFL